MVFLYLTKVAKDLSKVEFFYDFSQPNYTGQFKASVYKLQNTWGKKSEKSISVAVTLIAAYLLNAFFFKQS